MLTQENFQCFILNKQLGVTYTQYPPTQYTVYSFVCLFVGYIKRYVYNERVNIHICAQSAKQKK